MDVNKVVVEETSRGVRVIIPDDTTDSLVKIEVYHYPYQQQLVTSVMMRGNVSGGRYKHKGVGETRRPVRSVLVMDAPPISREEFDRRMAVAKSMEVDGQGFLDMEGAQPRAQTIEVHAPEEKTSLARLAATDDGSIDWRYRAAMHAQALASMFAVRKPEKGTFGAQWNEEAHETLDRARVEGMKEA